MSVSSRRRRLAALALAPALVVLPVAAGSAAAGGDDRAKKSKGFADVIALPGNFAPEGIADGAGTAFYAGSRPGPTGGAIYKGDLRTGEGAVLVAPQPGGASIGMTYDDRSGLLWVAGGPTGKVTAYDGGTGALIAQYTAPAAAGSRFLNDVSISGDRVYVTDSSNAELVTVPRSATAGGLELLPLTGDWDQGPGFNANGIRTLPGGDLLVVDQGALQRVDPETGVATRLTQTDGRTLTGGDGLELRGNSLYVVFGYGEDSVVEVDLDLPAGTFATERALTKPTPVEDNLERPTTAVVVAGSLFVVNGKFASPPTTDQEIVRVDLTKS